MTTQNLDQPIGPGRIQDGVPIGEAATRLGLSVDAVRKRIRRRSLRAYKAGGHWYVVLPASRMRDQDATRTYDQDDRPGGDLDAGWSKLVDKLSDEVAWLRRRLEESEAAQTEMRRLLAHVQSAQAARSIGAPASPMVDAPPDRPVTARRRSWWAIWQRG